MPKDFVIQQTINRQNKIKNDEGILGYNKVCTDEIFAHIAHFIKAGETVSKLNWNPQFNRKGKRMSLS